MKRYDFFRRRRILLKKLCRKDFFFLTCYLIQSRFYGERDNAETFGWFPIYSSCTGWVETAATTFSLIIAIKLKIELCIFPTILFHFKIVLQIISKSSEKSCKITKICKYSLNLAKVLTRPVTKFWISPKKQPKIKTITKTFCWFWKCRSYGGGHFAIGSDFGQTILGRGWIGRGHGWQPQASEEKSQRGQITRISVSQQILRILWSTRPHVACFCFLLSGRTDTMCETNDLLFRWGLVGQYLTRVR